MNHKRLIIIIILSFAVFGVFYFGVVKRISVMRFDADRGAFVSFSPKQKQTPLAALKIEESISATSSSGSEAESIANEIAEKEEVRKEAEPEEAHKHEEKTFADVMNYVPFTSQAPFAEWDKGAFQDGCEEAVTLMAIKWAKGGSITSEEAKKEILSISDYEKEKYGEYRDASAEDTAERIIKGYFGYAKVEYRENIAIKDIIAELEKGNLVITPMDGQKLGNPYYTPPGPERHMLLIIGYDSGKKEFITNDPGTKRGASYRYSEEVLFAAIRDYATGYHESFGPMEKNMIVVKNNFFTKLINLINFNPSF